MPKAEASLPSARERRLSFATPAIESTIASRNWSSFSFWERINGSSFLVLWFLPDRSGAFRPRALKLFPVPFDLEDFSAGAFLAAVVVFFSACFLDEWTAFLSGLALFARACAFDALGCVFFFTCAFVLAGFFATFFFGDLAIISVSPLGRRARAEA